jgi:pectin methylesterase-like acyl-CoA thioesterase
MTPSKRVASLQLRLIALIGLGLASLNLSAAPVTWNGPANATTANLWSDPLNWTPNLPATGDDVKFFDTGNVPAASNINNTVDVNTTVGSLQFGNTNGFHTTLITNGVLLNLTGAGGLIAGTLTDNGNAQIVNATITGGGILNINNTAAAVVANQGRAANGNATQRGILDLSGLNTFNATISRVAVGTTTFGGTPLSQNATGTLKLAQTNVIRTFFIGTAITANNVATPTNAVEVGSDNGNAGGVNFLFLGQTNAFYIDSIGVGSLKTTSTMLFNPAFSSPFAYFRGTNGDSSRIRFWTVGDMSSSGGSSANANGTNNFSGGTVDILVDTMSLGRDRQGGNTGTGVTRGTFIFTAGTVDVNTLLLGNQAFTATANSNPMNGVMVVNGPTAVLKVNTVLTLGNTTVTSAAATNTSGILNVTNGTVYANSITVGPVSTNINTINLANGTLVVTNALTTNAALSVLNISNSTLGLTARANGSLVGLVKTLTTSGPTNLIKLDSATVIFPSYPQQFPLIRYTTWAGTNNVGLASVPAWAPGASVVSNGVTSSLDLVVPFDPRPVFTAQPSAYSGNPGDNVTSSFAVTIDANSVQPLGYQWYYVVGGVTNSLNDGNGPSGTSTLSGATTANLQISNAQTGDSGNYFVVVTNAYGTNTSSAALLTISAGAIAPGVTGPGAVTATNGIDTSISDAVSGSPVPTVHWQYNGVDLTNGPGPSGSSIISGVTSATLIIENPQYPGDQGTYSLIAQNSAGLATNNTVLTVIVPPTIDTQPASVVVTNTQSASFTVVASGVPSPTYQWYKNSLANPISSGANPTATSATFTIANTAPSDIATYFVVVQNSAGSVTSSNVTLTVNSTMAPTAFSPANGATGVCYDTPLYITFSVPPTVRAAGKIKIFNVNNSATPVDTLDLNSGTLQPRTIATEIFNTYPVIITGNTAAIYPHLGVLTSNQTYYVTIDDGVFADASGAYFAGITATNTWQFTTKVSGPANATNLVVAQDYSGDFATVQGALDSLPANNVNLALINVKNGVYTEIVEFKKNNVVLRGQSRDGTIIGYANNSILNGSTHSRMAMKVNANDIALDNLTVTNSTAQDLSQAEALMMETAVARIIVNNCKLASYQDTLLANTAATKAYLNRSLIQGDVDFIWGGGNLFFTNCEVRWLIRAGNSAALGPNPSPSASEVTSNGFSFVNCALTTLPGANPLDTVGRTRGIAGGNTALINCFVSTNINGWSLDALPVSNFRNWYYGCTNDLGATAVLSNGIPLSATDENLTNASSAIIWLYGWQPQLSPNILTNPASQNVNSGSPATFSVVATGIPDPTYQWLLNGTNLDGATGASLTIPTATAADEGSYSVVVTTSAGTVTSAAAALTVNPPPNTAPVFTAPASGANFTYNAGVNIAISCTATDADVPAQTLTYSLLAGPTNAAVNSSSGNLTWRPLVAQGDSTNTVTVVVTDNGTPNLSATNSFTITVNPVTLPNLSSASVAGGQFSMSISGQVGPDYTVQVSTNLLEGWTSIATNTPATIPFTFTDTNALPDVQFYRVLLGP